MGYIIPQPLTLYEKQDPTFFKNPLMAIVIPLHMFQKSPSQSRTSTLYNFSFDLILHEQYRNPWNNIRIGKLVEDFDALAGTIALKVFSLFFKLNFGFCLLLDS